MNSINCTSDKLTLPKIYFVKHFGNHWQLFKTATGKMMRLYGAYEDQKDDQTIVRVLALVNGAVNEKFKLKAKMWMGGG